MLARESLIVWSIAHGTAHFGRQNDILATNLLFVQPAADQLLADASVITISPARIYIGRIDEIAAQVYSSAHDVM